MTYSPLLLVASIALCSIATLADADEPTTPVDPAVMKLQAQTAELKAETDLLIQQNALLTAKYGAPASSPTGSITNPEKFSAMGQWTLSAATRETGEQIADWYSRLGDAKGSCGDSERLLITSEQDRRAGVANAELIDEKLKALTSLLKVPVQTAPAAGASRRAFGVPAVAAAVSGTVGALDSLVALMRSDYTFADSAATADDLALRLEVASAMAHLAKPIRADVQGLMTSLSSGSYLLTDYADFDDARRSASDAYFDAIAPLKTDVEKARFAARKALLDAAASFDTALATPVNGQLPIISAALSADVSGAGKCVLYVKFSAYSASLVTRKRLLSKNDQVTAIAGGAAHAAVFDPDGTLQSARSFRIDERVGGKLSDVVESAEELRGTQRDYRSLSQAVNAPPVESPSDSQRSQ